MAVIVDDDQCICEGQTADPWTLKTLFPSEPGEGGRILICLGKYDKGDWARCCVHGKGARYDALAFINRVAPRDFRWERISMGHELLRGRKGFEYCLRRDGYGHVTYVSKH